MRARNERMRSGLGEQFAEDERGDRGIGGDDVEVRFDSLGHPLLEGSSGLLDLLDISEDEPHFPLEDRFEEIVLRAEVVVDERLVAPGRTRDLRRGRTGEALLEEEAFGRIEDGLLRVVGRGRSGRGCFLCLINRPIKHFYQT